MDAGIPWQPRQNFRTKAERAPKDLILRIGDIRRAPSPAASTRSVALPSAVPRGPRRKCRSFKEYLRRILCLIQKKKIIRGRFDGVLHDNGRTPGTSFAGTRCRQMGPSLPAFFLEFGLARECLWPVVAFSPLPAKKTHFLPAQKKARPARNRCNPSLHRAQMRPALTINTFC